MEKIDTSDQKRAASITVIGWIFIIFSILMILSWVMGIMAYSVIPQVEDIPSIPENMPASFKVMAVIFQNLGFLAFLQIILAIFLY